jgi:hypothetical protein
MRAVGFLARAWRGERGSHAANGVPGCDQRADGKRGYVLISLGNMRWSANAVEAVLSASCLEGTHLTWCLLDAEEAASRSLLRSIRRSDAEDEVRRRVIQFKTLLARAGVAAHDVWLSSELGKDAGFRDIRDQVVATYRTDSKALRQTRMSGLTNLPNICLPRLR